MNTKGVEMNEVTRLILNGLSSTIVKYWTVVGKDREDTGDMLKKDIERSILQLYLPVHTETIDSICAIVSDRANSGDLDGLDFLMSTDWRNIAFGTTVVQILVPFRAGRLSEPELRRVLKEVMDELCHKVFCRTGDPPNWYTWKDLCEDIQYRLGGL
jgi:hypothetical protein